LRVAVGQRLAGRPQIHLGQHVGQHQKAPSPGLLSRAAGWIQAAPTERAPLPIGVGVFGVGEILHVTHTPAWMIGMGVLGGTVAAWGAVLNRTKDGPAAFKAGAAVIAAGAWLSTAALVGVDAWMTAVYWGLFGVAYGIYRADDLTRQQVYWRKQKASWHQLARQFGIPGSTLLKIEDTRLGQKLVIDVKGAGRRASHIVASDLAERIAEHHMIPKVRVQVREANIAGRIIVSIRMKSPWDVPIKHPTLDPTSEIVLPEIADIREPQIVGIDPENGRPLEITFWDEDGARNILLVAVKGGGKSVLVSDVLERLTAADNVCIFGIDLSKAKEMRRWRKALYLSACGPGERVKALRMLEIAHAIIDWRAAQPTDDAVHVPTKRKPYVAVIVDEMSAALGVNDPIGLAIREHMAYITSKGRSEAVGAFLVGQRGTVSHLGTADIRSMVDTVILQKLNRKGEAAHAAGELGLELPDMSRYGEGKPGVTCIAQIDGSYELGRTFALVDLRDIDRIAAERTPCPLEPELVEFLGPKLAKLHDPIEPGQLAETAPEAAEQAAQGASIRESVRRYLFAVPDMANPSPEMAAKFAEAAAIRRAQAAEQTVLSDDVRARVIELLKEGTTVRAVTKHLDIGQTSTWRVMDRLRQEGVAVCTSRGRNARWHLAESDSA
jgi:hypothetical protein